MAYLRILNNEEVSAFLHTCAQAGHTAVGVKGPPPKGAMWDDGTPMDRPINTKWHCPETGECVDILYDVEAQHE